MSTIQMEWLGNTIYTAAKHLENVTGLRFRLDPDFLTRDYPSKRQLSIRSNEEHLIDFQAYQILSKRRKKSQADVIEICEHRMGENGTFSFSGVQTTEMAEVFRKGVYTEKQHVVMKDGFHSFPFVQDCEKTNPIEIEVSGEKFRVVVLNLVNTATAHSYKYQNDSIEDVWLTSSPMDLIPVRVLIRKGERKMSL